MVDLMLRGLSSSSLISLQLRQIHHNEDKQCKLCFSSWRAVVCQSPPRPRKWGRCEGCAAWGKQVPKGFFPPFSCLSLRPISQPLIYSGGGEKEGTVKGLYTPHSWKLIGLFTTHSVLRVRKCTSCSKSLRNIPPSPVLGPVCGWPKGSSVQTHICCLNPPIHPLWIGDLKGCFYSLCSDVHYWFTTEDSLWKSGGLGLVAVLLHFELEYSNKSYWAFEAGRLLQPQSANQSFPP